VNTTGAGAERTDVAVVVNYVEEHRGGASRQAQALANALAQDGHRVVCVARTPEADRTGFAATVRHAHWRAPHGVTSRAWLERFAFRVFLLLRRFQPEPRPGGRAERMLRRLARTVAGPKQLGLEQALAAWRPRCVLGFVTNVNAAVALACWDDDVRLVTSERLDPLRDTREEPWGSLEAFTSRRPDVLTANARETVEHLSQTANHRRGVIRYAPNISRFSPVDAPGSARRFVFVGRLVKRKRVASLIESFAEVRTTLPDWRLVIAGDGPDAEELETMVKRLGLGEAVDLLGHVQDVSALLRPGGVLVLPSSYEGTPNAVMEAMAHGLACIVAEGSRGPRDLVAPPGAQPAGLVVRVEEPHALANAMQILATDERLRRSMAAAGLQHIRSMEWPNVRGAWEDILGLESANGVALQSS